MDRPRTGGTAQGRASTREAAEHAAAQAEQDLVREARPSGATPPRPGDDPSR
jgi:hypothetical protein